MKKWTWAHLGLAGLFLVGGAASVQAQAPTEPGPRGETAFGAPVSAGQLAEQRGGAENLTMNIEEISNEINESAALTDNMVGDYVTTGANSISGSAFAGSSGISSVIQNTGNNVIIQDSTLVNITMKP